MMCPSYFPVTLSICFYLFIFLATSILEFWLRKNSEPRLKYKQNFYLESHRGGRSEPAGLHGLRKHVTKAKEGPLELKRKQARIYVLGEKEGVRLGCALEKERAVHKRSLLLILVFRLRVLIYH